MADELQQSQTNPTGVDATLVRHGGLSYLEIPAIDGPQSAAFYEAVLGWKLARGEDGAIKFSDRTGHLIGRWVNDRPAARKLALLPYFYVSRIDVAEELVKKHGGTIVKPPYEEGTLRIAVARDPAGNLIGLWQDSNR